MSDDPRCWSCGEELRASARVCRHCGRSALVDLEVEGLEPSDGREIYRVARAVVAARASERFEAVRARLASTPAFAARELTHEEASALREELRFARVRTRIVAGAHAEAPAPKGRVAMGAVAAIALLAIAGGGALVTYGVLRGGPAVEVPEELPRASAGELDTRALAARLARSTVSVATGGCRGSGIVIAPERVVTNAHVLCKEGRVDVALENGPVHSAIVHRKDDAMDLALLAVPGLGAEPIELGDATEVERGDRAYVFGNPRGLEFTLTSGVVGHARRYDGRRVLVQVDAPINPGNSGGPLVDAQARLIGVVTMRLNESDGLGLAVAVNHLHEGTPYVPAPRSQARWQDLVRELRTEAAAAEAPPDEREAVPDEATRRAAVEAARRELAQPWLLGATSRISQRREHVGLRDEPYYFVKAFVLRAGRAPQLHFRYSSRGRSCALHADAIVWEPAAYDARMGIPFEDWTRLDLVAAEVEMLLEGCPSWTSPQGTLELVGGAVGHERAQVLFR